MSETGKIEAPAKPRPVIRPLRLDPKLYERLQRAARVLAIREDRRVVWTEIARRGASREAAAILGAMEDQAA